MADKINGRTPEEIKKGLETCAAAQGCRNCPYSGTRCVVEVSNDALAYIRQLEAAQPGWISVENELPKEDVRVLVYFDGVIAVSDIYDTNMMDGTPMWTFTGAGGDPTHWMPLPEPPKEET